MVERMQSTDFLNLPCQITFLVFNITPVWWIWSIFVYPSHLKSLSISVSNMPIRLYYKNRNFRRQSI